MISFHFRPTPNQDSDQDSDQGKDSDQDRDQQLTKLNRDQQLTKLNLEISKDIIQDLDFEKTDF